ncbi:MAG: hypothetical protein J0L63_07935, partial [Anaerolineae bacterium]|nr:hypothetical protein [Anaerolineae bacterium]
AFCGQFFLQQQRQRRRRTSPPRSLSHSQALLTCIRFAHSAQGAARQGEGQRRDARRGGVGGGGGGVAVKCGGNEGDWR